MLNGPGGWKRVSCILFALTLASAGWAQEAFSHRPWQAADGLPSDVVQAFAETPDHALWIGTTNGLVRFDGSHFRYYQRENTPALGADSVFCLTVTRDGTLWIGVEGGGLVRYRDDHFREFTALDGLSNNVVRAILGSSLSQRGTHVTWQIRSSFSRRKLNRARPSPQRSLPFRSRRMPRAISRLEWSPNRMRTQEAEKRNDPNLKT